MPTARSPAVPSFAEALLALQDRTRFEQDEHNSLKALEVREAGGCKTDTRLGGGGGINTHRHRKTR
jgi:hypothetical protein